MLLNPGLLNSAIESWQNRGIIPRVLSFVFDEFERRPNMEYKMYVSFMEIYNEQAYDLLDQRHVEIPIESWNKVLYDRIDTFI